MRVVQVLIIPADTKLSSLGPPQLAQTHRNLSTATEMNEKSIIQFSEQESIIKSSY